MGTSVPEQPRWAPDSSPAEQSLWRWACEQLPDDVLVLPQVMMTVPTVGRPREAEADLALVDPSHGVTVVEVKGGEISYDTSRQWERTVHGARREVRDPVAQAKRTRGVLRDALAQGGVDVEAVPIRWAVATPDCRLEAPGAPVLPAAQLWDALASERLVDGYRATCSQLTDGERPLGTERAGYVADLLRGRTRVGRAVLSTEVDRHEAEVRVHTESHRNVLRQLWRNDHVLVRGAAGTGKTVLALEAAAQFASMGERVLLACWNVVLASWLRQALQAELDVMCDPDDVPQVTDDPTGQVVVSHLVGLARRGTDAEPPDPGSGDDAYAHYHELLPDALDLGLTRGPFDVVVLDEAQDLTELWVLALAGLVARGGRWYAFSDQQQDLFASNAELPAFLEVQHELRENFRNSAHIAAFARAFGDVETDCLSGEGPPVAFVDCPTDRVVARAVEVARKLERDDRIAASDLAVLYLFHNPYRGHTDEVAGAALAGELVTTNSASFKGMERAVVVLGLDVDPAKVDRRDEVRRAIYAAATRARSHLTVVGDAEVADAYGFDRLAAGLRDPPAKDANG